MDIWSSFGCFTSTFSNIGGLFTYLIPPKTSIIGMIGAILGYDIDSPKYLENIEKLYDVKISVQPYFRFHTQKITFNSHYGNESKNSMLNIKQDVLINPCYTLFIKFPNILENEESEFIEKIKNHETIYNLYMGRNEFFLNYNFIRCFDPISCNLNQENYEEFFANNNKVIGILDKDIIETLDIDTFKDSEDSENPYEKLFNIKGDISDLPSYFEYIIRKYPIKRTNFIDFEYKDISFFTMDATEENLNKAKNRIDGTSFSTMDTTEDYFFSNIKVQTGHNLELFDIGDNRWVSLI